MVRRGRTEEIRDHRRVRFDLGRKDAGNRAEKFAGLVATTEP